MHADGRPLLHCFPSLPGFGGVQRVRGTVLGMEWKVVTLMKAMCYSCVWTRFSHSPLLGTVVQLPLPHLRYSVKEKTTWRLGAGMVGTCLQAMLSLPAPS